MVVPPLPLGLPRLLDAFAQFARSVITGTGNFRLEPRLVRLLFLGNGRLVRCSEGTNGFGGTRRRTL